MSNNGAIKAKSPNKSIFKKKIKLIKCYVKYILILILNILLLSNDRVSVPNDQYNSTLKPLDSSL